MAKQIDADGGTVLVIQADNADPAALTAAVEQTVRQLGRIDILVNNAGVFDGGPLEDDCGPGGPAVGGRRAGRVRGRSGGGFAA